MGHREQLKGAEADSQQFQKPFSNSFKFYNNQQAFAAWIF